MSHEHEIHDNEPDYTWVIVGSYRIVIDSQSDMDNDVSIRVYDTSHDNDYTVAELRYPLKQGGPS